MTIQIPINENGTGNVHELVQYLNNPENPMHKRFTTLFMLKSLNCIESIQGIGECFKDSSCLLKHELAYCLGQMKNPDALDILYKVLQDETEYEMVRHEAAEAIGAIGNKSSLSILKTYATNSNKVIRQTCELAIETIIGTKQSIKKYNCIDPAPPMESTDIQELQSILLDESLDLYQRYKAMFALRDIGTSASVEILAKGFFDSSALFRHEIAYVFGQLQHVDSVPFLIQVLENESEVEMVRHEAAEALGSIGSMDCIPVLQKFSTHSSRVIKESCLVGLDMLYSNQ